MYFRAKVKVVIGDSTSTTATDTESILRKTKEMKLR